MCTTGPSAEKKLDKSKEENERKKLFLELTLNPTLTFCQWKQKSQILIPQSLNEQKSVF